MARPRKFASTVEWTISLEGSLAEAIQGELRRSGRHYGARSWLIAELLSVWLGERLAEKEGGTEGMREVSASQEDGRPEPVS